MLKLVDDSYEAPRLILTNKAIALRPYVQSILLQNLLDSQPANTCKKFLNAVAKQSTNGLIKQNIRDLTKAIL